MKGKNKLTAILFAFVALVATGVAFSFKSSSPKVVYAEAKAIDGFSAELDGGVIFSAERVYFADNKAIQQNYKGYEFNKIWNHDGEQYFADYKLYRPTETDDYSHKDVIHNGDYLLVDDKASYTTDEGTPIKQGVMVTLGGYYYELNNKGEINKDANGNPIVKFNDEDAGADMEFVSAQATLDGEPITLPNARSYNSGYNDFTWFITPGAETEGHYEITFSYMVNGEDRPLYTFEFYLLLQSSYEEVQEVNRFEYESKPTMENVYTKTTSTSTNLKYSFLSGTTTNYPTITFDYKRYDLTYTHVSGDVRKTIELGYNEANSQLTLSTKIYNDVYTDVYPIKNTSNSIVSLMLVDSGKYDFDFDYIYRYGDIKNVIPATQIDYAKMSLDIYGYQLKYSKAGYTSADMTYLEIVENGTMFILANGFTDEGLENGNHSRGRTDLGVNYKLVKDLSQKTGTIISSQTGGIESSSSLADAIAKVDYPKTDRGLWLTLNDEYFLTESFYLDNSGEITADYANAQDGPKYINRKKFEKVTTFTAPGYYLIQVKYQYKNESGVDTSGTQYFAFEITSITPTIDLFKTEKTKYDDIVNNEDRTEFFAREYTNQNVYANWKETEVFESKIKGKVYFASGKYVSENDLKAVADGANSSSVIYRDYNKNDIIKDSGSYLLVLEVGGSRTKTYTYFTIDKEDISGLQVYEVVMGSIDNRAIYTIKRDAKLNYVTHTSKGIIDSDFTLSWANKPSGAKINATYKFTPFVKTSENNANNKIIHQTNVYILNQYGISGTSKSISIQKPTALNSVLDANDVLTEQGIYEFKLIDEAGNELRYIVIIDRTEGVINATYGENKIAYVSNKLVSDYVELEWGTHKAIELKGVTEEDNKTIYDLMHGTEIDNYYGENGNNFNNIINLFVSTGGHNLFVVENDYTNIKLLPYDNGDDYYRIKNGTIQIVKPNGIITGADEFAGRVFENVSKSGIKINIDEHNGNSNLRRYKIDVLSSAHVVAGDSNSPFIVRITPDKALGTVYSASAEGDAFEREVQVDGENTKYTNNEPNANRNNLNITEYYTGQASDDGVFVFEWAVPSDTDNFKVTDVRYDYYQLMDQSALNGLNTKSLEQIRAEFMYYPYKWISTNNILKTDQGVEDVALYTTTTRDGSSVYRSQTINLGYESYYEGKNLVNKKVTQTGLYIITRTMVFNDDAGAQTSEFSYAFFVDRNAIVAYSLSNTKIVGQFIHASVPNSEGELAYDNFTKQGVTEKTQTYMNGQTSETIAYKVYLETNKLPTKIKVPNGKYVTGNDSDKTIVATSYKNLKLRLSVYFNDINRLLSGANKGTFIKLMDNVVLSDRDGYINLSFSNIYNQSLVTIFRNARIHNEDGSLSLPGEYVFVISDNVGMQFDNGGAISDYNTFTFGVRLIDKEPTTDVYAYANINGNTSDKIYADDTKTLYTNQEFVDFEIAKEDLKSYDAQLDIGAVEVWRTNKNGNRQLWLKLEKNASGEIIANTSGIVKDMSVVTGLEPGKDKYIIQLDTGLKTNAQGQIESYEEYVYQIHIKYILANSGEEYYTYRKYDENENYVTNSFYMATYTVNIDRSPYSNNLDSLMSNQGAYFTNYQQYVAEQEQVEFDGKVNKNYAYRNSIPAQDYYGLVNDLYYQMVTKSQTNNNVKVDPSMYALSVNHETTLNMDELAIIYFRKLEFKQDASTNAKMGLLPVFEDYASVGYHAFNENLPVYRAMTKSELLVGEEYYYCRILEVNVNSLENDYDNKNCGYYEIIEKDKAGNYTQYVIYFAPRTPAEVTIDVYGTNISNVNNGNAEGGETTLTINSTNPSQTTFIGIKSVKDLNGLIGENGSKYTQYYGNINIYNASREKLKTIYTNSTSLHAEYDNDNKVTKAGIESEIYDVIKNQGNYIIEYIDVFNNKHTTIINNYTSDDHKLNIANLQLKTDYNGQQYITISGVNSQIDANTYWYVTKLTIKHGNTTIEYNVKSYNKQTVELEGEWDISVQLVKPDRLNLAKNNIYLITLEDVATQTYSVMLSTGEDYGYKLIVPENVYMQNNIVYTANEVKLSYNNNFYGVDVKVYVNDKTDHEITNEGYYEDKPDGVYSTLTLNPDIADGADYYGSLRKFEVALYETDDPDQTIQNYTIWIDTRATTFRIENLNKVDKIDFVKSTLHNSGNDYNIIELKDNDFYNKLIAETVNITWTRLTSDYFTYNYDLYEFTSKDEYKELLTNSNETKYQFAPKDSNTGKYALKVTIKGKDGTWIASKVYGIYMSTTITGLYEVKDGDGALYDYSAITNINEIMSSIEGNENALKSALKPEGSNIDMTARFDSFGRRTAIPMYIANKQLMLHSNADNGVSERSYTITSNYTTIKIYHIMRSNYYTFAVTMEVYSNENNKSDILSVLSFTTRSGDDGENLLSGGTAKTKYDANAEFYRLTFSSYNRNTSLNPLERHNKILVDVYYDSVFAKRVTGGTTSTTPIEFKNSGSYKLKISDMAGNIQYFRTTASNFDAFTLVVMKDMLYQINDEAPIQYAYYDKPVTLEINRYNEATGKNNYDINSIKLSAILNGKPYVGYEHPAESSIYIFKAYGTYKIDISANLLTGEPVSAQLVFTIINPNEARTALDFTSIYGYNIISVFSITETAEKDVTDKFMELLQDKANVGVVNVYNKLVTYDRLTELFGTSTQGKMKFRVLYEADDDDLLPPRSAEFSFTLNNETATLNSSIKPGGKTTKAVTVKFNAANIYDQIGDCNLVINGEVVLRIDANSINQVTELKVEEVGQYYIQLVGDSGNIAHSFNFTIKEPLNMVSIILIVVVVAVVGALVGTFIWLRTRMKVR